MRATHEDVRLQIDALLDQYTDAQVARLLNQRGLRTGAGDPFDTVSVQWVRYTAKIKNLKQRLLESGWLTIEQISATLGLRRTSINRHRVPGKTQGAHLQ